MPSLANLTDKQNLLLTQLAYTSDALVGLPPNSTIADALTLVKDSEAKDILQKLSSAGLGSLIIKDVGNDSTTGFGAVAFSDGNGNTGVCFRGTDGIELESLNDWLDNADTAITGTSPQTAQAEAFFDKNCDPDGNNYLYGHSKGGELSQSVYANNYSKIKGVHLLNPQPINPYSLSPDQLIAMQSKKVDIVIVEGDYVWFLGSLPSYGNIRVIEGNGKNPHLYESIEDKYDEHGNIKETDMPLGSVAAYLVISGLTIGIQVKGALIGHIYNCTVRVVDYVKNDLIPAAQEFIADVVDKIRKFGEDLKDFVNEFKDYLQSVVDKAKDFYNKNFNYGYKQATANPEIVVDTYKLRAYSQRLQSVNRRLSELDKRIDALYWKVGLLDLWNLMHSDLKIAKSYTISRCVSYLDDTAGDFEQVEIELLRSL